LGPIKPAQLQNGDFERGQAGWRVKTRADRPIIGSDRPHSGSQSADFCGYDDCDESLAQTLGIPAGAKSVRLSYYTYIETQETNHAFDFLNVEIRDASGKKLRTIQQLSDGDPVGAWRRSSFDLSEFAGRTVQLVFMATSGKTKPTAFFVDDVIVE